VAKKHPLEGTRKNRLRGLAVVAPGWDRPEGRARAARRLADGLAAEGVPVTFLSTTQAGNGNGEAAPAVKEVRGLVQVWRLPSARLEHGDDLGLVELTALALLTWDRDRMDGVFAPDPTSGVVASRIGRALGVPVIVRLGRGGLGGDVEAAAHCARRVAALREATHVVVPTAAIGREATERLGVDPARLLVVPDGVDLELFSPKPHTPPALRQVVVLSALDPARRLDVALEAFARSGVDDAELLVAGEGPARAQLEAHVRRLGLDAKVRFLGAVEDVPELLKTASVLLVPAPAEGTPMALLEAMAMEVPAVVGRSATSEAVVGPEGHGARLVPWCDVDAMATALRELLADPAAAKALGQAGRARAQAAFELRSTALALVEAFERKKVETRGGTGGVLGTQAATKFDALAYGRAGVLASARAGVAALRLARGRLRRSDG
jgi:glycosyltransferase involved in cell wall biosynthesis